MTQCTLVIIRFWIAIFLQSRSTFKEAYLGTFSLRMKYVGKYCCVSVIIGVISLLFYRSVSSA